MFEEKIEELNQLLESKQGVFDKRTYTVDEIQDILSISKPSAYNLVKPVSYTHLDVYKRQTPYRDGTSWRFYF